jgi:hypothetical protein
MADPSATPLLHRAATRGKMFANPSFLWRAGALIAATGVITGAFGAHGLRSRPGITQDNIHAWETAAHYSVSLSIFIKYSDTHRKVE